MMDKPAEDPIPATLHELAEALQAIGNYLSALRRSLAEADSRPPPAEVVERGVAQWARAQHAMRELRHLLED